jgi:methionyl-tRNA formyltransferase
MVSGSVPLRIVYFGTPAFAVPTLQRLLDSRHPVVAVVSQPDRPKGRGHHVASTPTKDVAAARGVPVLQPDRIRQETFLSEVRALQPDLGVVAAYGKILPDALLAIPRLGMINVHASLLPNYRGAAPVHRAVIAGERETGVTIMRIVRELDAGPMFATAPRPIGPEETSVEVEQGLAALGAALLIDVVDALANGTAIETPQDGARATYAPKITKEEAVVDWSMSAEQIHNRVRGLQPWPLVSVRILGTRYQLHQTTVTREATDAPAGTIVEATPERFDVATGDRRRLRIVRAQPDGRRVMTARELLAGRRIAPGTQLDPP